jgi:hypothetical protein
MGIPVSFDFEIKRMDNNPDFEISPMKGVIPPNEEIKITVEFCPTSLSTAFSEFEFHVVKYDHDTVTKCTLVGSSSRLVSK